MLNSLANPEPRSNQYTPVFRDIEIPAWENEMLYEQGFAELELNKLKLKGADKNEYLVFANEDEFKAVEAETATLAMEKSETPNPHKITHEHCRLDDIIKLEKLEFVVKKEEVGVQAETSTESGDSNQTETTGEAPQAAPDAPAAQEAKPEETSS
jgi:hypothetical protein